MTSPTTVHTPSGAHESTLRRYVDGPALLENTLSELQLTDLDKPPADGGWTIRQIVHHIVDGDDIWKTCIKIALGNDQAEFTLSWYWSRTQEDWAERWAYSSRSLEESLALLKAIRNHVCQLLTMRPDGWTRSAVVRDSKGTLERVTVGFVVEMQADHLMHHVNRILDIHKQGGGT